MKNLAKILPVFALLCLTACGENKNHTIAFFGSSVCRGVGADSLYGYAYLYSQQLPKDWRTVNLSVDGNDTYDLLARFEQDLVPDCSKYVVLGVSLGNEGLHESGEAAVLSYKENLLKLSQMITDLGKVPVVMGSYVRADFNEVDYQDLINTDLEMMQWNMPTVSLLGALDDGHGRWACQCWNGEDKYHPNSYGHQLLAAAIPPTLFQALEAGKPVPEWLVTDEWSKVTKVTFVPEKGVQSYTLSYTDDDIVYTLVYSAPRNTTWRYENKECVEIIEDETISVNSTIQIIGTSLSDLFFFRCPLYPCEVEALVEGKMLRSSLEIYAPLVGDNPEQNLAQTMNTIQIINHIY